MAFISYSQNFEDIMLWRALKKIKNGFYIDVGANDPIIDSVTKSFYDYGWTGINIEPMKEFYDKLCQNRPNDINVNCAVGTKNGEAIFYVIKDTGLSTLSSNVAENDAKYGFSHEKVTVEMKTLQSICEQYVKGEIHFLKIDVEGAESSVIESLDLNVFRPWIILVETTAPLTGGYIEFSGERILLSHRYRKVYFDGLNTFYISDEHINNLKRYFETPPNVFDQYELYKVHKLYEKIDELNGINDKLTRDANNLKMSLLEVEKNYQQTIRRKNDAYDKLQGKYRNQVQELIILLNSRPWKYIKQFQSIKNNLINYLKTLID